MQRADVVLSRHGQTKQKRNLKLKDFFKFLMKSILNSQKKNYFQILFRTNHLLLLVRQQSLLWQLPMAWSSSGTQQNFCVLSKTRLLKSGMRAEIWIFFEELCPHCLKPRYLRTSVIAIISSYIFSLPLLNKKRVILRESAVAFVRYHISSHSS